MDTGIIIGIIAAVAVVIVVAAVVVIMKRRGPKKGEMTSKDGLRMSVIDKSREIISRNSKEYDALTELYSDKVGGETKEKLERTGTKLRYLAPSVKKAVYALDEKISDRIGDLKVEMSKKSAEDKDVDKALFEIEKVIADRGTEY